MEIEALWLIATIAFLLAGTIKGLVGLGLPTMVVGLLSQFTDPRQAIALLLLPILVSNGWQVFRGGMFFSTMRTLWPLGITMGIGILIFTQFAAFISAQSLTILVGSVIMLFAITNLFTRPLKIPDNRDLPAQIISGALAGAMGGLTSLWAPPIVMYLFSKELQKDEFVATLGFLLLIGCAPLLLGYWYAGLTSPLSLAYSAAMIIPTLIGFSLGEFLRTRLNGSQFRGILLTIFFLLGVNLIRSVIFS